MTTTPDAAEPRSAGLASLLKGHRGSLVLLGLVSVVGGLTEAAVLTLITRVAFAVTDDSNSINLPLFGQLSPGQTVLVALGTVAAGVVFQLLSAWQASRLSATVVAEIRTELSDAFLHSSWSAQHGEKAGRLQELLTTFTQTGSELISAVSQSTIVFCNLLALLIVALFIDPAAAFVLFLTIVLIGAVIYPFRKRVRVAAAQTATAVMDLATNLGQTSQLGMEMHVFNVQRQARALIADNIEENRVAQERLGFIKRIIPTTYSSVSYVALLAALAAVAVWGGGDLESIGAVTLIMFRSLRYGQQLQISVTTVGATLPFLDSLDTERARYEAARVVDRGAVINEVGPLELDHVSFGYTGDALVLRDLSARIEPREVVGVIGPSGSGKSTLVQLLLGLRDPTHGVVRADGRDIRTLSRVEWARRVTFVPQQAHLIAGTVADNIRFLRDDIDDERIVEASKLANLHDDVMGWSEGYDRQVGEQGSHLSGGQQQRLIIARALVERPDVIILDEPTSALDVASEYLIRQTLDGLRAESTVVIIAHRLSTLDVCDRIMVIMDGQIRGFDTPDRLEQSNAFYRDALVMSGVR
jgi:ABC-type multidrug transport system fused ATPase/permease subunit